MRQLAPKIGARENMGESSDMCAGTDGAAFDDSGGMLYNIHGWRAHRTRRHVASLLMPENAAALFRSAVS